MMIAEILYQLAWLIIIGGLDVVFILFTLSCIKDKEWTLFWVFLPLSLVFTAGTLETIASLWSIIV